MTTSEPTKAATNQGKLWGGRFASGPSPELEALSRSTHFDWRLTLYDIAGSHAHAKALAAAGLLSAGDEQALHDGLDVQGQFEVSLADLREAHTGTLRAVFGG